MSELGMYDRATRAAVSLLIRRGYNSTMIAEAIHRTAQPTLKGASKISRWYRYAETCKGSSGNRQWANYAEIKALVYKIAKAAEAQL